MTCPDCGIKIERLPCGRCKEKAAQQAIEFQILAKEFSLSRGEPRTEFERTSLDRALKALRENLSQKSRRSFSFDARNLLRGRNWWYVPYTWIGCRGFIIDSENGYVNSLGSALSLKDCFWGHEHGVFCDLVDFAFAPDTDTTLAAQLLGRFMHMHPNSRGLPPKTPVPYRDAEIPSALSTQFPNFKRHFVWFAIPELFRAHEAGLRFTSSLTKTDNQFR